MKIVQVINTMASRKTSISNIIKLGDEYFFIYDSTTKWSLSKTDENYQLKFFTSNNITLEDIANNTGWFDVDFVLYSNTEINTHDANEAFSKLYQAIIEKLYNLDAIFDDIISNGDLPF